MHEEWRKSDRVMLDYRVFMVWLGCSGVVFAAVGLYVLSLGMPLGKGLVLLVLAAVYSVLGVLGMSRLRPRFVERSRWLNRDFPVPIEEAWRRLGAMPGFEPEASDGRRVRFNWHPDCTWRHAPGARVHLFQASLESTEVWVVPPDDGSDPASTLEAIEGALGREWTAPAPSGARKRRPWGWVPIPLTVTSIILLVMNNGDGNVIQAGWMLGIIGLMTMLYFMTTKLPWEPPGTGKENKAEV